MWVFFFFVGFALESPRLISATPPREVQDERWKRASSGSQVDGSGGGRQAAAAAVVVDRRRSGSASWG